ncbi:unnamed protein product [Rhizoctonia solani]|uniref:Uncharacterized protein n=1 Tax=Rhizoctonia solani TaxID=456999 RepID=A0A8H3BRL5_9AGAM|nr:unnamed protein product [Rhizoctonia solani]
MRKHGSKATGSDSVGKDEGSESEDIDKQGEIAKGEDEEIQELASQTSRMSAYDTRRDEPEIPQFNDIITANTYDLDDLDAHSNYLRGSCGIMPPPPFPLPRAPLHPNKMSSRMKLPGLKTRTDFETLMLGTFANMSVGTPKTTSKRMLRCVIAETLTDEEIDSIIMLSIRQFGSVTQSNYKRIQYSYCHRLKLLSPYCLQT